MAAGAFPLTPLEEAILAWEQVSVPWNMHFDVTAPHLDEVRLRDACNAAVHHHELTRCGIERDGRGRPHWVPDAAADVGPIEVVACGDQGDVDRLRLRLLDTAFDLGRAPLVRPVVARLPGEDVVLTVVSHVLCDGLSLLRLVRSVARAYLGEPDPPPKVSLAEARAALGRPGASTWRELGARWSGSLELAGALLAERARVAPRGAWAGGGYGFQSTEVPADVLRRGRRGRASFDAYAMAALHVTVDRWNRALGAPAGRIGISQGVNLRPAAWADDVVVNLAVAVSVQTTPPDRTSIDAALAAIGPQLDPDRRRAAALAMVAGARAARVLGPARRARALAAAPANLFDTCVISNVGVQPPPTFDPAHVPRSWGSTIATPDSGMTIAVGGSGGRVQLDVRFRRERFDDDAVRELLAAFVATLSDG